MANEIISLGGVKVAFFFPIDPLDREEIGSTGTYPILTPSAEIEDQVLNEVLTTEEKAALDLGHAAVEIRDIQSPDGRTGAQILADQRSLYADRKTKFLAWYAERYAYVGTRKDAVV